MPSPKINYLWSHVWYSTRRSLSKVKIKSSRISLQIFNIYLSIFEILVPIEMGSITFLRKWPTISVIMF